MRRSCLSPLYLTLRPTKTVSCSSYPSSQCPTVLNMSLGTFGGPFPASFVSLSLTLRKTSFPWSSCAGSISPPVCQKSPAFGVPCPRWHRLALISPYGWCDILSYADQYLLPLYRDSLSSGPISRSPDEHSSSSPSQGCGRSHLALRHYPVPDFTKYPPLLQHISIGCFSSICGTYFPLNSGFVFFVTQFL